MYNITQVNLPGVDHAVQAYKQNQLVQDAAQQKMVQNKSLQDYVGSLNGAKPDPQTMIQMGGQQAVPYLDYFQKMGAQQAKDAAQRASDIGSAAAFALEHPEQKAAVIQGIFQRHPDLAQHLPPGVTPDQIPDSVLYQAVAASKDATTAYNAYQGTQATQNRQQQDFNLRQQQAAETQRHNRAMEKASPDPNGGAVIPGVNSGVHGADFLSTLPTQSASLVKALAEGRMAFPSGFALKSDYWQKLLGDVSQYDPSFDAINYNARNKMRADFTSGKSGVNVRALNTAIGHAGTLFDQIKGTASHGGLPGSTILNSVENAISRSSGDPGITQYEQTAGALSSELTQVFRGSGGAEADVQRYLHELNSNASADQKKAAVRNIMSLLESRLGAIKDQYVKGMGISANPGDILSPKSEQIIGKVMGNDGAQPAQIKDDAEYNALPSGAHFIGPDGQLRIKP